MSRQLPEGVYAANVTPFRDDPDRTLDVDAYRRHVAWLAAQGVTGVVPFGTNGEGPSVATSEKAAVLRALVDDDLGLELVPTLAEGNLTDTLALLAQIDELPVTAVLVLPPYYFRPAETDGLRAFFARVLESTRHPVLAYHIPKYAVPVPVELATELPFWGVKNSAGDPAYSAAVRASGKGVFLGTEDDLAGQLPDAVGAISALANIVPEQVVELHARVRAGDHDGAARLSAHLREVRRLTKQHASPAVLKRVAQARSGVPMGTVRPPLVPLPASYDASAAVASLEAPVC